MSKASISKMVYAEETRKTLGINCTISYNLIYRLKDIMCEDVAIMLDKSRNEIVSQIWDVLDSYDIDKDDIKMLKMLIKGVKIMTLLIISLMLSIASFISKDNELRISLFIFSFLVMFMYVAYL